MRRQAKEGKRDKSRMNRRNQKKGKVKVGRKEFSSREEWKAEQEGGSVRKECRRNKQKEREEKFSEGEKSGKN